MIKTKREMIVDIWKTNPFAKAWKAKLSKNKTIEVEEDNDKCSHICTSNCRRVGCNCQCGNYHCSECGGEGFVEVIRWTDTDTSYPETIRCQSCNSGND